MSAYGRNQPLKNYRFQASERPLSGKADIQFILFINRQASSESAPDMVSWIVKQFSVDTVAWCKKFFL